MDGNRRWAQARGLSSRRGHEAGVAAARALLESLSEGPIDVLTLFAFSSENAGRTPAEVSDLFKLFASTITEEMNRLGELGVQLKLIGDRSVLGGALQRTVERAEGISRDGAQRTLVLALGYGGRWDLATAAKALAERVLSGEIAPDHIDESTLEAHTALADLPPVDMCIRTGGEQRLSNFMLWQLAYAELFFTPVLWPDFTPDQFRQMLEEFSGRHRRFGVQEAVL
ncbi:MAG: di-trans,poly-cis-decaprenylcistransferase [Gammaproteobacteria bacterium AqS3]|nr:di-trans,poly-cis-decaprenylcistransferase [Gammaproteobacteria bacterium AqS3]